MATDSGQLNLHTVGESADSQSTNEYKQKLETSLKDNEILKSKLRESEKHLKQIIRDVRLLSSFEKGDGWFEKYNDVRETMKDQENEITQMLKKMKNESIISSELFERIRPSVPKILCLYGLPKVHKQNVSLRSILDMTNSPYRATAERLADILLPIKNNLRYHSISDSFAFVDSVSDANVSGKKMISIDVTTFFTNVPLTQTICFMCEFIEDNNADVCVPIHYLEELLLRCNLNG
ncbi:unnamed protein product [Trichobilharzia regenti]|nr:unnamed protein product [Trichobilharzia regenti]